MQSRAWVLVVALLLCAGTAQAARQSARLAARSWLQEHPAPQGDELAELKSVNPDAYAIVKALLTKRSLGLLNPKHPSASFAAPPPGKTEEADDAAASGPAAFQALAASGSQVASAAVYPEAPAAPAAHHDWLHWKPAGSAVDDEAMVNSVLGSVAELKSSRPHTKSLLGKSQASIDTEPVAEASQPAPAVQASQPAAPVQENSYLKGLDLGSGMPPVPEKPSVQENSYLKSADLGPSKPKSNLRQDSTDYLASFSWDDSAPKAAAQSPPNWGAGSVQDLSQPQASSGAGPAVAAQPAQSAQHKDALLAWLGGGGSNQDSAAAKQPPAARAPAPPAEEDAPRNNPYMAYLR